MPSRPSPGEASGGRRSTSVARVVAAVACAACWPAAAQFVDPLDSPVQASALAPRTLVTAVAAAGRRLVAVGQRGHALYSDDGGASWAQAAVPVSVDLTAVHFASPARGWAVGHGAVVLATVDGGRTWAKQLDARLLGPLLAARGGAAGPDPPPALSRQLQVLAPEQGNSSLLDVWFDDERRGLAVGAFNLVLRTEDGGETWTPWTDRADNPAGLHLYAVRRVGGDLYVVGERGLVLRLDPATQRLDALPVPYGGTFFGVTGTATTVIAFGLRGHAIRSRDRGATWEEVQTGVDTSLVAGAVMPDGRVVLVTQGGQAVVSAGGAFRPLPLTRHLPVAAVAAAGPQALVLGGPTGLRVEALP